MIALPSLGLVASIIHYPIDDMNAPSTCLHASPTGLYISLDGLHNTSLDGLHNTRDGRHNTSLDGLHTSRDGRHTPPTSLLHTPPTSLLHTPPTSLLHTSLDGLHNHTSSCPDSRQNTPSTNQTLLFSLDLEATGLSKIKDDIVEIGCCVLLLTETSCVQLSEEFSMYCKPTGAKMNRDASAVTGLTDLFLSDKPSFSAIMPKFLAFIQSVGDQYPTATRVLSAYNGNSYDFPLMVHQLQRYTDKGANHFFRIAKLAYFCDSLVVARASLDATRMKKRTKTGRCSYKLGDVYDSIFQKPIIGAHGALADCRAVCEIFRSSDKLWRSILQSSMMKKCSSECQNIMGHSTNQNKSMVQSIINSQSDKKRQRL